MPNKKLLVLLILSLPLFFGLTPAGEAQRSPLVDLLGKGLNFLILFGGLAFILAKPLRKYLDELSLGIEKTIRETERAKREAEDKLTAIRLRLGGLEEEVRKIKKEGEEAGEREKEKILNLARREAERLRLFAQQEIEAEAKACQRELREYAAELAVSLARSKIEKRLTPHLHARLIDNSIDGLEKLYEETSPR